MFQKISLLEEQLGKLVTDDPSVIESSLEKYGDLVYPDKTSVIHRFYPVPIFLWVEAVHIYNTVHTSTSLKCFPNLSDLQSLITFFLRIELVDRCFSLDSVEEIIDALVRWAIYWKGSISG